MKKFFIANKKLSFALLAGILTTAIALGGIFAWFTDTAGPNEAEVETAQVGVEIANNGAAYLYEWTKYGLPTQRTFISGMDAAADLAAKSAYLGEFWEDHGYWEIITPTDPSDWESALMKNDYTQMIGDDSEVIKITAGSIVEYVVRYVNTSNIPVYMRVKAQGIQAQKAGLPNVDLPTYYYALNATDGTSNVVYEDGYYYFPKPLGIKDEILEYDPDLDLELTIDSGDREAWVNITAYIDHNLDGYQNGTIDFSGLEVEVIQATNNAPYLAWGVENVDFEPYVAP